MNIQPPEKKSLWDLAIHHFKENEIEKREPKDSVVLLVGSKNGGKSSICYKFLERIETPKSTLALEYLFGRRNKGIETGKEICHIWELGGGTVFTELLEIPITPENMRSLSIVLILDLSKPEELWFTMEMLLSSIKRQIVSAVNASQDLTLKNSLEHQAKHRIPPDHEDINTVDPFPVPLLIIGSKYDLFQNEEFEKKKVLCKCLRYVAHLNAASLQFTSTRSEALITKVRASVSAIAFGTSCSKVTVLDHNKPLYVNVGADSFQSIGPLVSLNVDNQAALRSVEAVKQIFTTHFPSAGAKSIALEDPAADPHFKEPDIDIMRTQKDQELMEYVKQTEKKDLWY